MLRISIAEDGVRVITSKGRYSGSYLISSLPLGVMKHCPPSLFEPRLPKRKHISIARLRMGLLNKIVLCYDEAWWKNGESASWGAILPSRIADESEQYALPQERIPENKADAEWLLTHNGLFYQDYTTISGKNTLVFFLGPPTAHAQEMLDDEWVVNTVHKRVVESILPASKRHSISLPKAFMVTRWNSDPYSRGSYSYFSSASSQSEGSGPEDMLELARPAWNGRLGFAGEHTSVNW